MPLLRILAVLGLAVAFWPSLRAAQPAPDDIMRARLKKRSEDAEKRGLAEPFRGVTRNGTAEAGLFPVRSTGVSTAPVQEAAKQFLSSLTAAERGKATFPVDDDEWRKWMNQHFYVRQGVSFEEMSEAQRETALGLLRASLSAKGLRLSRDIMRLNHTLGELSGDNFVEYGEWLYWITVMGEPSATEPWGWQLDGHHLIVNYFVLGDQVVMTPLFVGSEPVMAEAGKYKGTVVLQDEQDRGLALLAALDEGQRRKAVIEVSKTGNNILGEAFKDNLVLDYAGIRVTDLTAAQKEQLLALAALYVDNMKEGHARVRMEEVRRRLDDTWFAWIGPSGPGSVYYYRVHSPVILIEFDHQSPANLRHQAKDQNAPSRQHIHAVVRTPNGSDYGKDLLRQHYQTHPH